MLKCELVAPVMLPSKNWPDERDEVGIWLQRLQHVVRVLGSRGLDLVSVSGLNKTQLKKELFWSLQQDLNLTKPAVWTSPNSNRLWCSISQLNHTNVNVARFQIGCWICVTIRFEGSVSSVGCWAYDLGLHRFVFHVYISGFRDWLLLLDAVA